MVVSRADGAVSRCAIHPYHCQCLVKYIPHHQVPISFHCDESLGSRRRDRVLASSSALCKKLYDPRCADPLVLPAWTSLSAKMRCPSVSTAIWLDRLRPQRGPLPVAASRRQSVRSQVCGIYPVSLHQDRTTTRPIRHHEVPIGLQLPWPPREEAEDRDRWPVVASETMVRSPVRQSTRITALSQPENDHPPPRDGRWSPPPRPEQGYQSGDPGQSVASETTVRSPMRGCTARYRLLSEIRY